MVASVRTIPTTLSALDMKFSLTDYIRRHFPVHAAASTLHGRYDDKFCWYEDGLKKYPEIHGRQKVIL